MTDSRKARCYSKVDLRSGTEQCRDSDELSEDGTMAACCCSVGSYSSQFFNQLHAVSYTQQCRQRKLRV